MKPSLKIVFTFSSVILVFLIMGFYYSIPDQHLPSVYPQKMNVFYIGVDNPVEITACGLAPNDLRVSLTGGSLSMTAPGKYIVRVSAGTRSTINVADSLMRTLGSFDFRVKRVPDPVAYVGTIKGDGTMTKTDMLGLSGIFARMENFDFDIKFTIVSFTLSTVQDGKWVDRKANGPAITPDMRNDLQKTLPGDSVLFHDIIVKGPDGTLRKIPGVIITVK